MVQIKLAPSAEKFETELQKRFRDFELEISQEASYVLGFDEIWWVQDSEGRKLKIDFDQNHLDYRRRHRGGGEPLARALGFKDGVRRVIDLTAGLGIDAVFLSQIGFQVTALERNPLIAFLLTEAKARSQREDLKKLEFLFQGSEEFLKNLKITTETSVYFDPMYPEKKKSALPRQEMVLFRQLVGADLDSESLLNLALQKPFHKVVVKRPVRVEPVIEKPSYQLESKLLRYDVYHSKVTL